MQHLFEFCLMLVLAAALAVTFLGAADFLIPAAETLSPSDGVIIIDAGHGGADGGAIGANTGVSEAGLNLTVAKLLETELIHAGWRVVLTRADERALAGTKKADMAARREVLRRRDAILIVSVHMNKFTDPTVSGPMAYYMQGSDEGQKLAQCVINAVTDALGRPRRLANPGDYFVLRECAAPAVLVECGFLSNAQDEQLLQDETHQKALAKAISNGLISYLQA